MTVNGVVPAMPLVIWREGFYRRQDIEALPSNVTGVYLLLNAAGPVYVGQGDIRTRLLAHLNGDNNCIVQNAPTLWQAERSSDPVRRERALIIELDPICNKRVG